MATTKTKKEIAAKDLETDTTTVEQLTYYRILAPLEVKSLLSHLNSDEKNSIALDFKKLENENLEPLLHTFIEGVDKQQTRSTETSENKESTHYKVDLVNMQKEAFNLFEEMIHVYGIPDDGIRLPVKRAKSDELNEVVYMNSESTLVTYQIIETEKGFKVVIEDSLTLNFDRRKKYGLFHLQKVKSLGSYMKCLQLINYYIQRNKFPFQSLQLSGGTLNLKGHREEIEEEIESYKELIDICTQIGISEDYIFDDKEDLPSLFNAIINIFKNKQYSLLNIRQEKLKKTKIINIGLSNYVKLALVYSDGCFLNLYSEEALKIMDRPSSITDVASNHSQDNIEPVILPDNQGSYDHKVSMFASRKIEEMVKDTNFDFDIVKLSFADEHHDIQDDLTITSSLEYIDFYDKSHDESYLEFALDLNQRYLAKYPQDDIAKVNIYLIKLKQGHELSEDEQNDLYNIQARAEMNNEQTICFACEVLLKNKTKAKRIFATLPGEEKEEIMEFPIYRFYQNLE
ncbi:DUF4365 domain-containing protein [Priestia megaterium]|uniref:DUF4365 domain-containing protein n=1 Tax=Priestia megaterium TaxID=1404 RepID=UPI002E204491|nr:DUF4365 domain-containing protein [Priestia megaterium]MED4268115.1 DUF4365 domain-containing protein [Priestia megaterium]MED4279589.1 DUF4365 domain-containing protein [Priestia megaterium]MED4318724.1 DUF4365 domain-containing protein [Priestia megaterium]